MVEKGVKYPPQDAVAHIPYVVAPVQLLRIVWILLHGFTHDVEAENAANEQK